MSCSITSNVEVQMEGTFNMVGEIYETIRFGATNLICSKRNYETYKHDSISRLTLYSLYIFWVEDCTELLW